MTDYATYSIHGYIAVITLNKPPINGLGVNMRAALLNYYLQASNDNSVQAIIITSANKVFCAGADINEFSAGGFNADPHLPDVLNLIEASRKPVVAAINGTALGGGLELTLACDFRFAHPKAKLGLPEVTLGILPGAGGTQRLPRIIAPEHALTMITLGKAISAELALEWGLVNHIHTGKNDFLNAALHYTRQIVDDSVPVNSCADTMVKSNTFDQSLFNHFRNKLERGFFAPERCIQAVEIACSTPLMEGLAQEEALFKECHDTPQARALQHVFFAARAATKIPGVTATTQRRTIKSVAVVGAETLATATAMCFANADFPVCLVAPSDQQLTRTLAAIEKSYSMSLQKSQLSKQQVQQRLRLIQKSTRYQDLAQADLVIEATTEASQTKLKVFEALDKHCKPGAILATSTSTMNINAIAQTTSRPQEVIGLHFISPANVAPLLEVIRGRDTAKEVLATAMGLGHFINKTTVVAGACRSFVGRMLEPYRREACRLILEGANPAQVDEVLTHFGMTTGFPSMLDLAGIDVDYLTRSEDKQAVERDPSDAAILDKLYSLGRYGTKIGRGFYCYDGQEKTEDPEVIDMAVQLAQQFNIQRRDITDQEILERILYMLINEGAKLLAEGISYRASDIDLACIHGYGFPLWRGGPMQYANEIGLDVVFSSINTYRQQLGDYGEKWFKPASLLETLASKKLTFNDYENDLQGDQETL